MKPIFTVHAGEYLVGSEIEEQFPDLRVWVPSKDTGIDLLVTTAECRNPVSVQVKFSKDFLGKSVRETISRGIESGGWWTFNRTKIEHSPADYWILVLYQFQHRKYDFVIISPSELLKLYDQLDRPDSIQSYVWVTNAAHQMCWETRGLNRTEQDSVAAGDYQCDIRNLTSNLNNWEPILDHLKR